MSDVKFGSWAVPEAPFAIEYSLVVIEEIRHEVTEGYQRLSRGGIEVGGVLYGTRDESTIRVLAIRPIACEHAHGPAFQLSDNDTAALDEQLIREQMDSHLARMVAVGWFVSHTRTEVTLTGSDLAIYSKFFPAPWQVTLIIRPGRGGSMRAGFFVREEDGTVKGERSYMEFNFPDRLAGVLDRRADRPLREQSLGAMRRNSSPERAETASQESASSEQPARERAQAPFAAPRLLPPAKPRRKWPLLVIWAVLVLAAAVVGLRYWMLQSTAADPISLSVIDRDGQLQIDWNHSARTIATASRGSLEIVDGTDRRTLALTPQNLAAGEFTYARKSGDVEIQMTVENVNGRRVQETSRFLGQPPASAHSAELTSVEQRRAELEQEVNNLRQENGAQAARIQQLERTLRILQTRLGIDRGK